ncbi:hypothetical protein EJ065_4381 [Corallococcus coralloides]|uniref:Uncharacterized protein n=1 Tax=Corallococcus coralloides TaxID=184914 RepID=A0A410RVJ5_CORCK|nr:hypothetical protein EJ065_4381 [Corallococcus coralloides]
MAEKERRRCNADIHAWMSEKSGKRIASCISPGAEFIEYCEVLIDVPVGGFGISQPAGLCLCLHLAGELLNQFFEFHHQTPFLMFAIACNPNARWAS